MKGDIKMSATNKTTYYELPIFIGTDTPSWLGDWNSAMKALDSAMNNIHTEANSAKNAAMSAQSATDANTQNLAATNKELETLKKAVQNYDEILDFKLVNCVKQPNNVLNSGASGSVLLSQNTNKTLNSLRLNIPFNDMSNPVTYQFSGQPVVLLEMFTIEDNVFNLNQSSLPNTSSSVSSTMWLGAAIGYNSSNEFKGAVNVYAWFDGATTHVGVSTTSAVACANYTIVGSFAIFLSGSVYSPDDV